MRLSNFIQLPKTTHKFAHHSSDGFYYVSGLKTSLIMLQLTCILLILNIPKQSIIYPSVIFINIIQMHESPDQPSASPQPQPKTESKKNKASSSKSSGNIHLFVNLLLIVAIGLVLYSSQFYRESLSLTREILGKKEAKDATRTSEPIKTSRDKKNVMCPDAKAEYDSCLEKRDRCKKTQKQFENAQKQFTQLISDCARSNEENERLNTRMEEQITQMQANLLEAEKQA